MPTTRPKRQRRPSAAAIEAAESQRLLNKLQSDGSLQSQSDAADADGTDGEEGEGEEDLVNNRTTSGSHGQRIPLLTLGPVNEQVSSPNKSDTSSHTLGRTQNMTGK